MNNMKKPMNETSELSAFEAELAARLNEALLRIAAFGQHFIGDLKPEPASFGSWMVFNKNTPHDRRFPLAYIQETVSGRLCVTLPRTEHKPEISQLVID